MAKGKAMRRLTDTLGRAVGKSKRKVSNEYTWRGIVVCVNE